MKKVYKLIATVCGAGYLPFAPGTWGSLAGLFFFLVLSRNSLACFLVFAALFAAGKISADKMETETGRTDPSEIVIDEFVGIFFVFMYIPLTPFFIATGFVIYRIMDIFKPPPIKSLEKLKGGWGVMLDDVLAGIYTCLVLHLLLLFRHLTP